MRATARTLPVSLALLVTLGAAACGNDAGDDTPLPGGIEAQALLRDASADLASQSVEARFAMTGGFGGESFEIAGDMAVDPTDERARMSFTLAAMPGVEGDMTMETIVDGDIVYVRGGFLPDAGWLKVDGRDAEAAFEGQPSQLDPAVFLEFLRGADDIEVVGSEDVRGVETTHFSGTLDVDELAEHAPADAREDVKAMLEQLEDEFGEATTSFDAWVDASGVPWRVAFGFSPEGSGEGVQMTIDVLEIGGDVEIELPPADEVTDLGAMDFPQAA